MCRLLTGPGPGTVEVLLCQLSAAQRMGWSMDSLICQLWQARAWDRGGSKMTANGRLKARMVRFCTEDC
jgi:hypothetical protein